MTTTMRLAHQAMPLALVAVMLFAAGLSVVCSDGDDDEAPHESAVGGDDDANGVDDDTESAHCYDALNDLASRCGAEFLNSAGNVISQNDLVEACGEWKVDCIVGCYDADPDCAAVAACLADTCKLE